MFCTHSVFMCFVTNKGSQQMQLSIYLYCIRSHPTSFGPPTGPSPGVSRAASSCRHLAHAVLLYIRVSADGGLVVLGTENLKYVFCVDLRTNREYFPIQH
jgi:hypothetical protein